VALKWTERIGRRAWAASAALLLAGASALAQPVAVVTDVQGVAALAGAPGATVAMLQQLHAGQELGLAAGTRLALAYYANGAQYELRGPGNVSIDAQQPHAAQGATVHARPAAGPAPVRLKPAGLVQGAVVMRNLGLRVVAPDPQVLSTRPELAWTDSRTGTVYDVAVFDASGARVFETTTRERRSQVPESRSLAPGQPYALQVSARIGQDVVQVARAEFRVAPAELQAQAKALAPAADAAVADRVAYALWLEQNDLRDEARRWWAAIAHARPDQAALRQRADVR